MKKSTLFIISGMLFVSLAFAEREQGVPLASAGSGSPLIAFQYDNEELVNIVNYIASKKEVNILFPTKSDEKLTGKLTWHLEKKSYHR